MRQLAAHFGIHIKVARQIAKSKRLRAVKGAVLDLNVNGGRYEKLVVNVEAVKKVFGAEWTGLLKAR